MTRKGLREVMRTKVPLWLVLVALPMGAFFGAWQQAEARAEHDGTTLSWASNAVFLAPIVLLAGLGFIAGQVPAWRKRLRLSEEEGP